MSAKTIARHAHASEEKEGRRRAILDAANALFVAGDGSLPTAAEIASATKLAKGTVYLYFRTKEEIFAALLLEGWSAAMAGLDEVLEGYKGKRSEKIEALLLHLVAHLKEHPGLLRLDALGYGVLEKNMELGALRLHKSQFTERLLKAGGRLDRSLRLADGRGVQLRLRTYALTRGLWESYEHAEQTMFAGVEIAQILLPRSFAEDLLAALTEYWRGALS